MNIVAAKSSRLLQTYSKLVDGEILMKCVMRRLRTGLVNEIRKGEIMKFEDLVCACSSDVESYLENGKAENGGYNIYKILHITNNEVLMCRVLADLLNPSGSHQMGCAYLHLFLKDVIGMDVDESILQDAHVYKEYLITNDRRIDIVLRFQTVFIPIEVKINAGEQKSQCYDYFQFARKRDRDAFVVYLTKFGDLPSYYSICGGINDEDSVPSHKIHCISFSKDIIGWLEEIEKISTDRMKVMIIQYMDAIKDFTENAEEKYLMGIVEKISDSSESLRTSIEIAKAIDEAKAKLMYSLFQEFEKQMLPVIEKYGLEEEKRSNWFHYSDQANKDFYAHNESTYPGLNYIVKKAELYGGLSLWLRIEIEHRLFAGFCLFNYNLESEFGVGNQQDNISQEMWDEVRKYIELPEKQEGEGWIVDWKYLPTGSSSTLDDISSVPDFKTMNEAAIKLADDETRKEFVRKCIQAIEDSLLSELKQ